MTVNLRAKISEYANRVLGVIKEKYGLKDKSEAIDKFAEMFGQEFVEPEMKEKAVKDLIHVCEEHFKKHKNRRMSLKELDKLCEI
ncbi:antitoxin [Candidatus Woesearchaeota archaeon]|nr:MAG: antitoxin [Candidatus Woesearchaeota archaeon]